MLRHVISAACAAIVLGSGAAPSVAGERHTLAILIENVSNEQTLKLPTGETKRVPVAPGAYAVVRSAAAIVENGSPAGQDGLEALAEDGNSEPLLASLRGRPGVRAAGMFIPGQPFIIEASPGDRLVFAAMFVESNDLFYSPGPAGIPLFDEQGRPVMGEVSDRVRLWDAGTELNEAPGAGENQAPRQKAADTGPSENGVVRLVDDGFVYPEVPEVLRITISGK